MRLAGGAVTWNAETSSLGKFLLELHNKPSWILRRVETVTHLDAQRIERRTTLDIDCAHLRDLAFQFGVPGISEVPIPLAVLPKGLLLDVDVRSASGHAMAVAVSNRDAASAALLMMARLAELPGVDPASFNSTIPQKLYDIAADWPSEDDEDAFRNPPASGENVQVEAWRMSPTLAAGQDVVDTWLSFFDDDVFASLAITFTLQYMLTTSIDLNNDVCVVKLRHVEVAQVESEGSLAEKFGIDAFYYRIGAPAVGRAAREHFRLIAPPGTFLEDGILISISESAERDYSRIVPAVAASKYQLRITPERAVVYTKDLSPGSYSVMVGLRPALSGFVGPALVSVGAALLLLLGGLAEQIFRSALSRENFSIEAAVAILLIFPSISSAYIAREGEHELLRRLLTYPRIAVGLSAVATIVAAGIVVVHHSPMAIRNWWIAVSAVNALVFLLLALIWRASRRAAKEVLGRSGSTEEAKLLRF